jgi:hypothetical protein
MKYFMGLKFSPAGPRKLAAIIVLRPEKARARFPPAAAWHKMKEARRHTP